MPPKKRLKLDTNVIILDSLPEDTVQTDPNDESSLTG